MGTRIDVTKDPSAQQPIPEIWRQTLVEIVEHIRSGDFALSLEIPGVPTLSASVADAIEDNISAYGATLTSLPEAAWETSVCQWMGGYWELVLDLYSEEEGATDLVLSVRVRETGERYTFDVTSVHVP